MKRFALSIIFVVVFISIASAQWNPDTILIWDNDRGLSRQTFPAVGSHGDRVFLAWQDSRWGDHDIYRQTLFWGGGLDGKNEPVSIDDYNRFHQIYPDITANPANEFVTVWEDSSYRPANRTMILCRIQDWNVFCIDEGGTSRKQPSIDSRESGEFVVTWAHNDNGSFPTIMYGLYDRYGSEMRKDIVRQRDSIRAYVPISRVAYCDSGFLVVYEDSSRDGSQRSIYGNYYKYDGALLNYHVKISCRSGDTYNEQCPDVAVCNDGYGVAVWQDSRSGAELWAQEFVFRSGGISFSGSEMQITDSPTIVEYGPRAAVFMTSDFVVVWHDVRSGDYNVWYRSNVNGWKQIDTISVNINDRQMCPDIHTRYGETVAMTWMSRALSSYEDVFARHWALSGSQPTGLIPITGDIKIIPSSPDTGVGGKKCWYFDDENYDNPLTPWNEDPVDEPDSVYADLEYAMLDQLMELNTNGQYFVVVSETLPIRYQGINGLGAYEAILLDYGYRTADASAGVMSSAESDSLRNEIIINGAAAMMEGNDFGSMYSTSSLFRDCFYASYKGDGAPYTTGNIDTLYGRSMFAIDETLKYDYQDLVDNYVDSISAISPGRNILMSGNPLDRWSAFRSVGWGNYFDKDGRPPGNTLYHTFPLSGIKSTDHPNTYSEFYRRCMGFLGLNCQPEPITNLMADTVGFSEGKLQLIWTIVSDDSLRDPCNSGYTLKFSRTKMTNDAQFNAAETYYQTWTTPGAYGDTVKQSLGGLPPLDTLIFALKVEDEDGLINALGAEPQTVVPGDSVSPHTIMIGNNYVKDFSNAYEMLHAHSFDTLFVTWDASYIYIGFARISFNGSGDFFVYMDVTSGGPDSTYPQNGLPGVSRFNASPNIFYPDYVFVVENSSSYTLYQGTATDGNRDTWNPITFNGGFMEDNVVNGYQYTEIAIPFSNIGYNTSNPFKLIVIVQSESSNSITRIYPTSNPTGPSQIITNYYYWSHLGSGLVPNKSYQLIGITEQDSPIQDHAIAGFDIIPNPNNGQMQFIFPANTIGPVRLSIYDVSGRKVIEQTFEENIENTWNWNAADSKGNRLPAGIYFAELEGGSSVLIKKVVLLK
ncbi:hypothetical protein A2Y85_08190 [candidate division WOR-3 bacterium RBG_13_43_14]|uniref:Secretion system C-terminal sorting domain-containing protein n=1 Tax=candidate division WOR-3 bacterium RBG_13_43_14 TaxID=1802590 RepID=A0A1F4U710_UNCW3|nr:MAG: hypothetical protein A2Y85_08190 [candidate division WOR-3 bacterium RBG_13_43_14]